MLSQKDDGAPPRGEALGMERSVSSQGSVLPISFVYRLLAVPPFTPALAKYEIVSIYGYSLYIYY